MARILRLFILVLLTTVALVGCSTEFDSSANASHATAFPSAIDVFEIDCDTPSLELLLPRQNSGLTNVYRSHYTVKRLSNRHKNNVEFVKGGKIVNVSLGNFIQQQSFKNLHRFVRSASWLISLGKLIIQHFEIIDSWRHFLS